jgi:hypothetical protein
MLRTQRHSANAAGLRMELPSLHRMPPPSRLPEMDMDDALPQPSVSRSRWSMLATALARIVRR